jgi:hypothetical protein
MNPCWQINLATLIKDETMIKASHASTEVPMKKIVMLLAVLSLLMTHGSTVSAKTKEADLIQELIQLPVSSYDAQETHAMVSRIERINADILERLVQNKVKIRLITGKLTDEPEYRNLKGVTPRGWEGTGKTWDDIPGIGGNPVILRIGYSENGKGHGSLNLELHEISHAIDMFVFESISQSEEFKNLFDKEAAHLYPNNNYMDAYAEEYFAETSCMYFYSDETRTEIKDTAPLTYAFFNNIYDHVAAPAPQTFNDMAETHWAYAAITKALHDGYVDGYNDGTFKPDNELTRAEFVKMLTAALGLQPRDIKNKEAWYIPYLEVATKEQIVTEKNLNHTNWNVPITRQEMAEFCVGALHSNVNEDPLQTAVKLGILQGSENGMEPERSSTRAQSITVIERTLGLLK